MSAREPQPKLALVKVFRCAVTKFNDGNCLALRSVQFVELTTCRMRARIATGDMSWSWNTESRTSPTSRFSAAVTAARSGRS